MNVTEYMWDPVSDNVLTESDENGDTTAEYTNEPGQFGELVSQRRDNATGTYHFDASGSTRQLTDESETVAGRATYSAFGQVVAASGMTLNPFGYKGSLGYYANAESQDTYVRARTYSTREGRWVSLDPIPAAAYSTPYGYSDNHPIQLADPSGLWPSPWATTELNVDFGAPCSPDIAVDYWIGIHDRHVPQNPVPFQVWAYNEMSGFLIDTNCLLKPLTFRDLLKPNAPPTLTNYMLDVWDARHGDVHMENGISAVFDGFHAFGVPLGGVVPKRNCLVFMRGTKTIGVNSVSANGQNETLPRGTGQPVTQAQLNRLRRMRIPGVITETYFAIDKKSCSKCCSPLVLALIDWLADENGCIECYNMRGVNSIGTCRPNPGLPNPQPIIEFPIGDTGIIPQGL